MAERQPEGAYRAPQGNDYKNRFRQRRVMLGIGLLLIIVVTCVVAILTMLQRLETRDATFQPPMTALERQRLLPQDPVLDTVPRLDGLRYGDQGPRSFSSAQDRSDDGTPLLSPALMLPSDDLRADAQSNLHTVHQTP